MVSRRQYFAIMLIFFIVFVLFQGLQLGKLYYSTPNENQYAVETDITSSSMRKVSPVKKPAASSDPEYVEAYEAEYGTQQRIIYVGFRDSEYMKTATEWAFYTGRAIEYRRTLPAFDPDDIPYLILIEPSCIMSHETLIMKYLTYGTNFVFLNLPDVEYVSGHTMIKRIIGIYKVRDTSFTLHGMHLFPGFFLGGERVFDIEDPVDPNDDRQDLELTVPWYTVRLATETYMQGILTDDDMEAALKNKLKNEDLPAVIWRSHFREGNVFVVNGNYLENRRIGIGMLESFINQITDYELYPVVNARTFTLSDYPILTNENEAVVERIYGESIAKAQTDIILPMLISLSAQNSIKPTVFFNVKYNADDPHEPEEDALTYYFDMLFEIDGELGLSLSGSGDTHLSDRLTAASDYYRKYDYTYPVSAAYIDTDDADSFSASYEAAGVWDDISAVTYSTYDDDRFIIGYINDTVTYQQPTSDLDRHTFTNDLELIGVQTLLAYNSSAYNVAAAFYPESASDEWHQSSQRLFSNLITYDTPFENTDQLTVTESSMRVRNYLSVRYTQSRKGNVITLNATEFEGHAYFVLRLHNEEIVSTSGCSFRKLEKDAYIIDITEGPAQIVVKGVLSDTIVIRGGNR